MYKYALAKLPGGSDSRVLAIRQNDCHVEPLGEYRPGPYGPIFDWCGEERVPEEVILGQMKVLEQASKGHDYVFAYMFGSVPRCYFPDQKRMILNPNKLLQA